MEDHINGVIDGTSIDRKSDYLYRLSLKGVIINDQNEVLIVKEDDREFWDIPGGGMDHGETLKQAIAREMHEEVSMTGDFDYQIIAIEDPMHLRTANILQVRLIFRITPQLMDFKPGIDGTEVRFVDLKTLEESPEYRDTLILKYARLAQRVSSI